MSNHWVAHCLDCGVSHDFNEWGNRNHEGVAAVCALATEIAAVAPLLRRLREGFLCSDAALLVSPYSSVGLDADWFEAHAGHRVVARGQHGLGDVHVQGECSKMIGFEPILRWCRLPSGHADPCSDSAPAESAVRQEDRVIDQEAREHSAKLFLEVLTRLDAAEARLDGLEKSSRG